MRGDGRKANKAHTKALHPRPVLYHSIPSVRSSIPMYVQSRREGGGMLSSVAWRFDGGREV